MNRALESTFVDPALRRAIAEQGTLEASIPLMGGIGASLIPGITGLGCAMVALKRRSQPLPVE